MTSPRFLAGVFLPAVLWILRAGCLGAQETTLIYPPRSHAIGHRATSSHLRMFLGVGAEFQAPKGIACAKLRRWDDPGKDSDDDELFLVLVNSGRKEILYNNSMTTVTRLGEGGGMNFTDLRDIAVDVEGNVYVAAAGQRRITKLCLDEKNKLALAGNFQSGPGSVSGAGPGLDDGLREPVGLCASFDGSVYVADRLANRILCMSREGKTLRTIDGGEAGEKGIFKPVDVDVMDEKDPWNFFKESRIFVIDMDGRRIQRLSMEGEREAVVYSEDLLLSAATFYSLAVDYYSQVYVTDPANHCVHKFDRNLRYLTTCGKRGTGDHEFLFPTGIAIWKRFGQVFVADATGVQYFWVGTDILLSRGEGEPQGLLGKDAKGRRAISLTFDITEPSEVSVTLVNSKKDEIPLIEWRRYYPLTQKLSIPLRELTEADLSNAQVVIRARATYSSKSAFEKKITLPVRVSG